MRDDNNGAPFEGKPTDEPPVLLLKRGVTDGQDLVHHQQVRVLVRGYSEGQPCGACRSNIRGTGRSKNAPILAKARIAGNLLGFLVAKAVQRGIDQSILAAGETPAWKRALEFKHGGDATAAFDGALIGGATPLSDCSASTCWAPLRPGPPR